MSEFQYSGGVAAGLARALMAAGQGYQEGEQHRADLAKDAADTAATKQDTQNASYFEPNYVRDHLGALIAGMSLPPDQEAPAQAYVYRYGMMPPWLGGSVDGNSTDSQNFPSSTGNVSGSSGSVSPLPAPSSVQSASAGSGTLSGTNIPNQADGASSPYQGSKSSAVAQNSVVDPSQFWNTNVALRASPSVTASENNWEGLVKSGGIPQLPSSQPSTQNMMFNPRPASYVPQQAPPHTSSTSQKAGSHSGIAPLPSYAPQVSPAAVTSTAGRTANPTAGHTSIPGAPGFTCDTKGTVYWNGRPWRRLKQNG